MAALNREILPTFWKFWKYLAQIAFLTPFWPLGPPNGVKIAYSLKNDWKTLKFHIILSYFARISMVVINLGVFYNLIHSGAVQRSKTGQKWFKIANSLKNDWKVLKIRIILSFFSRVSMVVINLGLFYKELSFYSFFWGLRGLNWGQKRLKIACFYANFLTM